MPNKAKRTKGATILIVCIIAIVLMIMVAFSVEVGRMYLVRSQLQTAVDAGALAATLQLKEDPNDMKKAMETADEFVQLNRVGWLVTVPKDAISVHVGVWDDENHTFSEGDIDADSVQVSAELTEEPLFFASVLGFNNFSVPRSAIARKGGEDLDIIMTLDLSSSMGSEGRIEALRVAAPTFTNIIEELGDNDRIGVFCYGAVGGEYDPVASGHTGAPYLDSPHTLFPENSDWVGILEAPLTIDFDFLRSHALNSGVLVDNKYGGGTPIGASIRDSAHYLQANARERVGRVIVLMSDGEANKPESDASGYSLSMAYYAKGVKCTIYTISLGNSADEDLMQEIADTTGGKHFRAVGSAESLPAKLTQAFHDIAEDLKQTQLVK